MARGGPRKCVFGPRGTGTSGIININGPPRFFDLFLARGQKYLRSTAAIGIANSMLICFVFNRMRYLTFI